MIPKLDGCVVPDSFLFCLDSKFCDLMHTGIDGGGHCLLGTLKLIIYLLQYQMVLV